jgi:hypothetical protein
MAIEFGVERKVKGNTSVLVLLHSDNLWKANSLPVLIQNLVWSPLQLIRLLESSAERADRLRQNSPLVSLLPDLGLK